MNKTRLALALPFALATLAGMAAARFRADRALGGRRGRC